MLQFYRRILFIFIASAFSYADAMNNCKDVALFKRYFCDSLQYEVDLGTFALLNNKLERDEYAAFSKYLQGKSYKKLRLSESMSLYYFIVNNNYNSPTTGLPVFKDSSVHRCLDAIFQHVHQLEKRPEPYPLKLKMTELAYYHMRRKHEEDSKPKFMKRLKTQRAQMKRYIKNFKNEAQTLPLFYQIIDKAYDGNVDAYVDDLFDNSIFSNYDNLFLYRYYSLSSLRLRLDPLVIHTICCAQYLNLKTDDVKEYVVPSKVFCNKNIPSEKKLFKEYFIDSIREKIDITTLNSLYSIKKKNDADLSRKSAQNGSDWGFHSAPVTWWPDDMNINSIYDNYNKKYLSLLGDMFYRLHLGYNETQDKARMKRLIKNFRLKASKLPTFYECIDKKFHGDIDAYVDYLFEESYFIHKKRFLELEKWLKRRRLSRDPLVKYTLSVMQYLYCD